MTLSDFEDHFNYCKPF